MHQTHNTEFEVSFMDGYSTVRVRCTSLFHMRHRSLCREIAEALLKQPGIGKAHINLDEACLKIDFVAGAGSPDKCGNAVATAIQEALGSWNRNKRKPASLPARRKQWTTLTAYSIGNRTSVWETLKGNNPARLYIQHPSSHLNRHERTIMADSLLLHAGILRCQASPWWSDHLEVEFDPLTLDILQIIDKAEEVRITLQKQLEKAGASTPVIRKRVGEIQPTVLVATGTERVRFFIKASVSFLMTVIGLIVPGIPTLPFLVLTSYYLARSSPWLHIQLLNSRFFGDILRDWEHDYALTRASKEKLLKLLAVVACATLLTMPATPVSWLLIAASVALSLYGIQRMPDEQEFPVLA